MNNMAIYCWQVCVAVAGCGLRVCSCVSIAARLDLLHYSYRPYEHAMVLVVLVRMDYLVLLVQLKSQNDNFLEISDQDTKYKYT